MMLQQMLKEGYISRIALPTGATLNVWEQGDETGDPLILLHGYTDSSYSYARVLPLLSQRHHVFAIDLRGHGDSSKASGSYTMQDLVADVIAFMDAKGVGKATIVGHSLGSMVAQLVVLQHPERMSRLILIGAIAFGSHKGLLELNSVVQTLVDPIDPEFVREFQVSTLFGNVPPEFLERVIVESLKMPAHIWRQVWSSFIQQDTTGSLPNIQVPLLMLWGDQDTIASWSDQEILSRLVPVATLRVYEQTGHALHWEQPERFVADLEQFLQPVRQSLK